VESVPPGFNLLIEFYSLKIKQTSKTNKKRKKKMIERLSKQRQSIAYKLASFHKLWFDLMIDFDFSSSLKLRKSLIASTIAFPEYLNCQEFGNSTELLISDPFIQLVM